MFFWCICIYLFILFKAAFNDAICVAQTLAPCLDFLLAYSSMKNAVTANTKNTIPPMIVTERETRAMCKLLT